MTQASQRVEVVLVDEAQEAQSTWESSDLSPFAGEWVALRDGRVVCHDRKLATLRRHEAVREDDLFFLVPRLPQLARF